MDDNNGFLSNCCLIHCTCSQVSGSKFYYLKNEAVMLELGLINWTLSEVMKKGFTPLTTPEIVRSSVVEKCGFQPRGANTQVFTYLFCHSSLPDIKMMLKCIGNNLLTLGLMLLPIRDVKFMTDMIF